jgi:hypothetical protein
MKLESDIAMNFWEKAFLVSFHGECSKSVTGPDTQRATNAAIEADAALEEFLKRI